MKGYKWERKLTLEQRKEIIALYLKGVIVNELARKFKVDHASIQYHIRKIKHLKGVDMEKIGRLEEKEKISKELKEHRKENPVKEDSNYVTSLPKKGKTYQDYLAESKAKKTK